MISWTIIFIVLSVSLISVMYHVTIVGRLYAQIENVGKMFLELPQGFEETKTAFNEVTSQTIPKLHSYARHGAITLILIIATVFAKALDLDALPIPFWACIGFTVGIMLQLIAVQQMSDGVNQMVKIVNAKLIQIQLKKILAYSEDEILNPSTIGGIDLDLLKDPKNNHLK